MGIALTMSPTKKKTSYKQRLNSDPEKSGISFTSLKIREDLKYRHVQILHLKKETRHSHNKYIKEPERLSWLWFFLLSGTLLMDSCVVHCIWQKNVEENGIIRLLAENDAWDHSSAMTHCGK